LWQVLIQLQHLFSTSYILALSSCKPPNLPYAVLGLPIWSLRFSMFTL
jgi:hypothetical protein